MVVCSALTPARAPPREQASRSGPVVKCKIALLYIATGTSPECAVKHRSDCKRHESRCLSLRCSTPDPSFMTQNEACSITSSPFTRRASVTTTPPSLSLRY